MARASEWLTAHPGWAPIVGSAALAVLAWLSYLLARRYILRVIARVVKRTRFTWDDILQRHRVFGRLAHIAPAAVVYYGLRLVPGLPGPLETFLQRLATAAMVLVVAAAAGAFLTAVDEIYRRDPAAKDRPIKGYLQIVKIFLYIVAAVLVVSLLIDRSPVFFLSGIGAMTAVILLIFRDTILSLVASVQLASNDMIRIGDWIEAPQFGADGDVVDIALHTVTVQNWDKTLTTIPTHKLISDSFKNWRGMQTAGGRRIKRAVNLDLNTVRFLTHEEIERFSRWEYLRKYMRDKLALLSDLGEAQRDLDPDVIPSKRMLTNVGTFRAYVLRYLREHPMIHKEMTLLVRQLAPSEHGLPLQIYAFSSDTNWSTYEGLQADIFDHILSIVPEFGLRVFQEPAGTDFQRLAAAPREPAGPAGDSEAERGP